MSNELQLLENVELKLALCNTDAQLERTIQIFLPPVLLKLGSTHEQVKKKVMEILSHINKRVKTNNNIKLPFDTLLSQFTDDSVSTFIKNFTLIYLEMSTSRLATEDIASHIPDFLKGISARPQAQRIALLHIVLPVLHKWDMSHEKQLTARAEVFQFDKHPMDVQVILGFFLDVMLYQPLTAREIANQQDPDEQQPMYTGLSPLAIEEVTKKGAIQWSIAQLRQAKLGIMKFILTPIFTDSERLPLLVAGVCDPNHEVTSACEDGMRRWTGSVDYEDIPTIQSLYKLYLGTKGTAKLGHKDARSQAPNSVKLRVIQYLQKSIAATNMVAQMIQVIFDGIYGESTTPKLQRAAMSFLQWCARMGKDTNIGPVAPIIISGLLKYIDQNDDVHGYDAESIKGYAYVACGLVAKKVPKVALKDTQILSLFFDNLEKEQKNIRTYVQDALSSMIEIYVDLPEDSPIYKEVQDIILTAVQKSDSYCRYMALKYANAIYPFSNIFARYVCLLGSSNSVVKLEVKEESHRGLIPFVRNKSGLVEHVDAVPVSELPKFMDMIEYIHSHKPSEEYKLASKTPTVRGYPVEVYADILSFLRLIWILEVNSEHIILDEYVADKVENSMSEDPITRNNFKKSVTDLWLNGDDKHKQVIQYWLELIENGLDDTIKDPVLLTTAGKCLLEIISLGPSSISTTFQERLNFFKSLALSEKSDARILMSHVFGIIASNENISIEDIESILTELCSILDLSNVKMQQQLLDRQHGAILTMGYLIGRCQYRKRTISQDLVARCVTNLVKLLDGSPSVAYSLLAGAACQSIGEIGRTKLLPFPTYKSADQSMDIGFSIEDVIDKLVELSKSVKAKIQEKALSALGQLTIPLTSEYHKLTELILDALFVSADSKQVELAFTAGESWSIVAFGWESQAMQKYNDISEIPILADISPPSTDFQPIIDKIIRSYIVSDRSWYRKAACIWLLSILKFGKDHPIVKRNLGSIHASFSRLLGDRDDFTQECASKGLGLVYEYGDKKIKEDMLYSLVGTFTEGRTIQAQSVSDNTVLFDEGSLGETPDGNSITTYKELCSLASELNQPDLIYKFMNLANNNAMWASRRGAAFGFQNLMALAEKEMEPYLPRLIPKLYRYQFDPNPRVNQTMKSIWRSLVKDNQKTIDTYFVEIIQDLLTGLGNRQWRIREGSCLAITDLIQGRRLAQIEPYLEQLWQMCFRALDDIKDSVRQAATQSCRSLTKLTVHYCDPSVVSVSDGEKVMDIVMPFLLHKGIVSDAEDVRKFSLDAVLRVCKTGAVLLKKYVPDLIDTLLQSLSSLEPQSMNYLSFHIEKYNISQEQLDNARLSGAKNSPMMEGIEHCVDQMDHQVMQAVTPRILQIIRKGTGLPTKAGCARLIVTFVMNKRSVFEPFADEYLKALSGTIRSKNAVVRKSYATAIGYVCQLATYDRLIAIIKHLKKLYIDEEDEDSKAGSAVTVVEMTRFATDRMKSIATAIVPLIFFGENDPDENLNKIWKAAWENLTSGTRSMVSLYADEILEFVKPLLSSSSWKIKQAAALTIASMCKSSGKDVKSHAHKLLPVMISTLATRSWDGKENVLDAFAKLCISTKESFDNPNNEISLADVSKIMIREAKRKNRTYQRHALISLTSFMDVFGDKIDMLEPLYDFLAELCQMDEVEAMEDEDNDNAKPLILMIKANSFKAIVSAYRPKVFKEHENKSEELSKIIATSLSGNIWNVQLAILNSLKTFIEHSPDHVLHTPGVVNNILQASYDTLKDLKYSAIRLAAVDVLEELLSTQSLLTGENKRLFVQTITDFIKSEPMVLIRERLQKLISTVQTWNI